jgi:chromosome partitioning protein
MDNAHIARKDNMEQLNRSSVKWLLERINDELKRKDMPQAELARAIGVSPPNLNRAFKAITENGEHRFPDLQLLLQAAKALEIKVRIVMTAQKTRVIALYNANGGQGKTITSMNLAYALARRGYNILLIDGDPQSSATKWLDVPSVLQRPLDSKDTIFAVLSGDSTELPIQRLPYRHSFDFVPNLKTLNGLVERLPHSSGFDQRLKKAIQKLQYDFVLIDCPPSRDSRIQSAILNAATEIIVPMTLVNKGIEGIEGVDFALSFVGETNPDLKITALIPTRYSPKSAIERGFLAHLIENFGNTYTVTKPISVSSWHEHAQVEIKPMPLLAFLENATNIRADLVAKLNKEFEDVVDLITDGDRYEYING